MNGDRVIDDSIPLAVIGCDFRVASTAWRNALLLDTTERRTMADALRKASGAHGLVVLETCNRVEWIVDADQPGWAAELARAQMIQRWQTVSTGPGRPVPYVHVGEDAARHLLRVALGMESFVLGEREIAGQLNRAMSAARRLGLASAHLGALQTSLGRAVKRVHRLTRFGAASRGVHGLAVDLLRRELGANQTARVAVVGMGEIGRKAAMLAEREPTWNVVRANRTTHGTKYRPMAAVWDNIGEFDAVIVATGAREVLITPEMLNLERERPLVVTDLGAPAQVSIDVDPASARIFGLDALLDIRRRPFEDADLNRAAEMVEDAVAEFGAACRKQGVAPLLRGIWDNYDTLITDDLPGLLSEHVPEADRARLQLALRDAIRGYTRQVIDGIERALDE
ncbi:MAG: hypothetical protein KC502_04085 [Myxococcales bacterium]|nr:hypothetical protein [Myxococcales bacterium]